MKSKKLKSYDSTTNKNCPNCSYYQWIYSRCRTHLEEYRNHWDNQFWFKKKNIKRKKKYKEEKILIKANNTDEAIELLPSYLWDRESWLRFRKTNTRREKYTVEYFYPPHSVGINEEYEISTCSSTSMLKAMNEMLEYLQKSKLL